MDLTFVIAHYFFDHGIYTIYSLIFCVLIHQLKLVSSFGHLILKVSSKMVGNYRLCNMLLVAVTHLVCCSRSVNV